jgi:DNA polymerase/3'-5' exonuclease PolX
MAASRRTPSLLKKYRPSMLELLKIQGLGPKTIALIWSAYQVSDLEGRGETGARGQDPHAAAHGREA